MRTKHQGEDAKPAKNRDKDKKRTAKQEVAKVVTPERAVELNSVITQIAASTAKAHEAAGEPSPIPLPTQKHADGVETNGEPERLLEAVLEALPEPKGPGEGRRRSRRVTAKATSPGEK
jgi:ribonuclease E